MAGRILNRRELRKQSDEAEQAAPEAAGGESAALPKKRVRAKAPAGPKARKPRAKKVPARMRVRWGVFDAGMHQIAVFDYNQRDAADAKVADLLAKKKGLFFLQVVKEPMPEPAASAEAAAE